MGASIKGLDAKFMFFENLLVHNGKLSETTEKVLLSFAHLFYQFPSILLAPVGTMELSGVTVGYQDCR